MPERDALYESQPLVSIMMPCYNSADSLPWAISSVLAQLYVNWELVIVDDGSTDNPERVVEQAADERIELIRLPKNMGRGYARQVALNHASGEYICMLDADDWMYPDRIERQVAVFREHPEIALVSAGLAICDTSRQLVGVRATGDGEMAGPVDKYYCPVAHASSMFLRSASSGISYNPELRLGQDTDFLARVLWGNRYCVLDCPLYSYEEFASVNAKKAADAMKYRRIALRDNVENPLELTRRLGGTVIRQMVYRASSLFGLDKYVLLRRSRQPTHSEIAEFESAKRAVISMVGSRFSR